MGFTEDGIEARVPPLAEVRLVVPTGEDDLLPACAVALGLEAAGRHPRLSFFRAEGEAPRWAPTVERWFAAHDRGITAEAWDGGAGSLPATEHVFCVGGGGLLALEDADLRRRVEAARAAGGTVAAIVDPLGEPAGGGDREVAEAALATLAAMGGLIGVEAIARYGAAGRHFVELVEEAHHASGPEGHCTAADTLRASLFGRHGRVPVNLATMHAPRRVGPMATLVWYLELDELLADR